VRAALQSCDDATPPGVRAKLELAFARLSGALGRSPTEMRLAAAQRALALYEQAGDPLGIAEAKGQAGLALVHSGRLAEGAACLVDALAAARACNAGHLVATMTSVLAIARYLDGDLEPAREMYKEALALFRSAGCARAVANETLTLAEIEFRTGNVQEALQLSFDATEVLRRNNDWMLLSTVFSNCAAYSIALRRFTEARDFAREAMVISHEQQFGVNEGWALQHLAAIAALRTNDSDRERPAELRRAACLLGFVEARVAELEWPRTYTEQQEYDKMVPVLRDELGNDYDERLNEGTHWSEDRAVAEALEI
jgi:tetratricopeptide (TPR) repeat protein